MIRNLLKNRVDATLVVYGWIYCKIDVKLSSKSFTMVKYQGADSE